MLQWMIGEVRITQVVETEAALPVDMLFPGADPALLKPLDWIQPFLDENGLARLGINAYLVETSTQKIVVDCCAGNSKQRGFPGFSMLTTDFLDQLAQAGFGRQEVDTVVCTHLHVDHVGWNTMLEDGEWVPTFPRARYLLGRTEFDYWSSQLDSPDDRAAFDDSVQPVFKAGLVDLVEAGHQICDEAWLIATPGHTPGHHSVRLSSGGDDAIITGDMVHHPAQIAHPDWSTFLDTDATGSASVRRQVFADTVAGHHLLIGTHFVAPTAGRLIPDGESWRFDY